MAVKRTILVVDDDEDVGELVQEILQAIEGYRVFRVTSGSDAYAKIKNAKIDLIVTDFRMPKMSGVELYSLVRGSKLNSQIPMLFLSGNIEDVKSQIQGDPLVEFSQKPFDANVLMKQIEDLFHRMEHPSPVVTAQPARPQVDVSIMNQFITATISTLSGMASLENVKNEAMRPLAKKDSMESEVSGIIQMSCSKFNGSLIVSFPDQTLLKIYNKMLGEEKTQIDDEIAGTAGEMVNIIWGRTKTLLEAQKLDFKNAMPTVFYGAQKIMAPNVKSTTLEVPFRTEMGDFHIVFTIHL